MTQHKWGWCCDRLVVFCGTCGLNQCSGGTGPKPGLDESCPDCESARTLDMSTDPADREPGLAWLENEHSQILDLLRESVFGPDEDDPRLTECLENWKKKYDPIF